MSFVRFSLITVLCLELMACGKAASPATKSSPASPSGAEIATAPSAVSWSEVSGLATSVEGKVEILLPGEKEWQALTLKAGVPKGARIRAAADGTADILLLEKGAIRVKPGTEVEIEENRRSTETTSVRIHLSRGRLLHRFEHGKAGLEYRVRTRVGGAVIRGTEFDVIADEVKAKFRVLKGKVLVENEKGSTEVSEEEGTELAGDSAPAPAAKLSKADLTEVMECGIVKWAVALQKARTVGTLAELRNLTQALEIHRLTNGSYPSTLAEAGIGMYKDNWGSPYRYKRAPDAQSFQLVSNGPDRTPETDDDVEFK